MTAESYPSARARPAAQLGLAVTIAVGVAAGRAFGWWAAAAVVTGVAGTVVTIAAVRAWRLVRPS